MKRILKVLLGSLLVFVVGFGILYLVYNEPIPETVNNNEADRLAYAMLFALNHKAYNNTRFLEWSFRDGSHQFLWDKSFNIVKVSWGNHTVNLNIDYPSRSIVYTDAIAITGKPKEKLIQKAVKLFHNDSFWLVAPFKVFDKGTTRGVVALEDGSKGLLVTYTEGGTTPGDSYLWILHPDGFPKSYKMWTQLLPIGGIEATWDNWRIMESGTFLPQSHKLGPFTLNMGKVRAYN